MAVVVVVAEAWGAGVCRATWFQSVDGEKRSCVESTFVLLTCSDYPMIQTIQSTKQFKGQGCLLSGIVAHSCKCMATDGVNIRMNDVQRLKRIRKG